MTYKIQRSQLIKRIHGWKLSEGLKKVCSQKSNPHFIRFSVVMHQNCLQLQIIKVFILKLLAFTLFFFNELMTML